MTTTPPMKRSSDEFIREAIDEGCRDTGRWSSDEEVEPRVLLEAGAICRGFSTPGKSSC